MLRTSMAVMALLVSLSWARAGEDAGDNPFRNAKVGDWAKYEMNTEINMPGVGKQAIPSVMLMSVTKKDDKAATVKIDVEISMPGMPQPMKQSQETVIPLDQAYDSLKSFGAPAGLDVKQGKTENQKVDAAGQSFDCTYQESTINNAEPQVEGTIKAWSAKGFTFSLIRMETSLKSAQSPEPVEVKIALIGFGDASKPAQ